MEDEDNYDEAGRQVLLKRKFDYLKKKVEAPHRKISLFKYYDYLVSYRKMRKRKCILSINVCIFQDKKSLTVKNIRHPQPPFDFFFL